MISLSRHWLIVHVVIRTVRTCIGITLVTITSSHVSCQAISLRDTSNSILMMCVGSVNGATTLRIVSIIGS